MEQMRKLPIGIQTFEKLREENYLYVDKTALVYRIASTSVPYFLSRPRRFGKSLLISTFEAYFQGRKDLFEGLAIEKLETEWKEYPVFHLDLNAEKYDSKEALEQVLSRNLSLWEDRWGKDAAEDTIASRFAGVLRRTYEQTGKQAVVLIDEYDKPFAYSEELNEKLARQCELNAQLDLENAKAVDADLSGPEEEREADDRMESAAIVAEDKGAYPADREGRIR